MSRDLDAFRDIVGPQGFIDGTADAARPYLVEWRDRWRGDTPLILRPADTAQAAAIISLAARTGTPIVPQGGNTGLVGGQIPLGPEILVSLDRMTRVRGVDAAGDAILVDAGVTLARVQAEAEAADRLFPLSLASEGSATIGGLIATNAGGTAVLRYGPMRDLVLGLEVVLPDGQVLNALRTLRKDNTGFDLKHLFIGSEGTLGLITGAALKLHPRPRDVETAWLALSSLEAAVPLLALAKTLSGGRVTGFELVPRIGLDFLLRHRPGMRDPLSGRHDWHALVEMTSGDAPGPLRATMEAVLAEAFDQGLVADAVLAEGPAQGRRLWDLREGLSEVQKFEGGSIKHDVAVPLDRIADFVARASAAVTDLVPGCRPVPFGHVGDGNIHFNVSQPPGMDRDAFLGQWEAMARRVHDIVAEMGGSFSAEHGIGRLKVGDLRRYKSPVEVALMGRIKAALDPQGLFAPGRVLGPPDDA